MESQSKVLYPVQLDLKTATFEAGGHTYIVEREARLSLERDHWLEKFSLWAGLGRQSSSLLIETRRAFEALNSGKIADASVVLHNVMTGAADIAAKESPLYYVCTLFINREDEDRATYDLEFAKTKIATWSKIEAFFFKKLAVDYLTITAESFDKTILNYSPVDLPNLTL